MTKKNYFQISTAIDYPSNTFHLGHGYEKICTDVLARWMRLRGFNVHFSTGTDCHGSKIERAAESAGKSPLKFVTEISDGFRELCKVLNISYNDFLMTIEPRHKKVAQYILKELDENGDVYKGFYEGLYCVDCESYYTEKELDNLKCKVHNKPVELVKEESYFFRLSKYQNFLIGYIKNNKSCIWPEKKRKEILNRLKEPLKDLSISRKEVKWGIQLPFDKNLTEFVWIEALNNYLTTIEYPNKRFKDFWPAMHVIGSDIVWHHSILWYSILKSLKLDLPRIVVHGFINIGGKKLSKASGLRIDPIELAEKYTTDGLRYFLIREIPFGDDGDFNEDALKERINNELANDLGNLVSRVLSLAEKNFKNGVKKNIMDKKLTSKLNIKKIDSYMEKLELHNALAEIWKFINECNKHINDEKPWEMRGNELEKHLYNLIEAIRIIAILISAFMPETAGKIFGQLGVKCESLDEAKFGLVKEYRIKKGEILFKKV